MFAAAAAIALSSGLSAPIVSKAQAPGTEEFRKKVKYPVYFHNVFAPTGALGVGQPITVDGEVLASVPGPNKGVANKTVLLVWYVDGIRGQAMAVQTGSNGRFLFNTVMPNPQFNRYAVLHLEFNAQGSFREAQPWVRTYFVQKPR